MEPRNSGRDPQEKLELANRIAQQSRKVRAGFAQAEGVLLRILRFISSWIDKIIFNPHYGKWISLVLALLLVSIYDNTTIRSYSQIVSLGSTQIHFTWNTEVYEYTVSQDSVNLEVVGELGDITTVESQGGYSIEADLMNLSEGTHVVRLVASEFPSKVEARLDPSTITVTVRRKISRNFSVGYEFINADKLDGRYVPQTPTFDRSTVVVRASEETLNKIASVKALIDVAGKTESFEQDATLVAYDQQGNKLDVDIVPTTVHANVVVNSPSKTVSVVLGVDGEIPNSMAIDSYSLDHQAVTIYASESALSAINRITMTVKGTELTSNKTITYPITLPSGVYSDTTSVTAQITLKASTSKVIDQVPIKWQGNTNNYKFTLDNSEDAYISVTAYGTQGNLDQLSVDDFEVYIDFSGLEPGTHELKIKVNNTNPLVRIVPNKDTIKLTLQEAE